MAYRKKLDDHLEGKFIQYVKEPDYESHLGLFHHINADMKRVFDLLVDKPAVIFIDDLDRCPPNKVVEVIEAINLMMNGDFRNKCYFIIGMDHHMVAASLDVAYLGMQDKLLNLGHKFESVGVYFLDKFIQLPFYLPSMSPQKKKLFLSKFLKKNELHVTAPVPAEEIKQDAELVAQAQSLEEQKNIAEKYIGTENQENFKEALIVEKIKQNNDSPIIDSYVEEFSKYLNGSPRELKRFANLLRFHSSIQEVKKLDNGNQSLAASTYALAKWLTISLRWPHFVRWLQWQSEEGLVKSADPIEKAKEIDSLIKQITDNGVDIDKRFEEWENLINGKKEKLFEAKKAELPWINDRDFLSLLIEKRNQNSSLVSAITSNVW